MKSYGSCLPGGPLNARAVPYPIGVGVPHVAPKPLPSRPVARPDYRALSQVERSLLICQAYAADERASSIASRLGISRETVYVQLRAAGVQTRRASS